jgi:hypothetical protein
MKTRTVQGIPVDPKLPEGFWSTPNEGRPARHARWWGRPFIRTYPHAAWPQGVRFDVYCLDGGAWDRPTAWGWFGTLEEAIRCVQAVRSGLVEDFGTENVWKALEG